MTDQLKPLIAANWKMHGEMSWLDKPLELDSFVPQAEREHLDVLICPPFPFIASLHVVAEPLGINIGAQNCHDAETGAHTGEVSAAMVEGAGASYVFVGHSERRASGETDSDVLAKAQAVIAAGITPIICVGESLAQREAGEAIPVVLAQLKNSVPEGANCVIAYEPIWAIGTGKVPTLEDIAEMHAAIRKAVGPKTRILYGGSVKPANASGILAVPHVNGALIGGASLEMESLAAIAKAALH